MNDKHAIYSKIQELFSNPDIRGREFYPDFRRSWDDIFQRTLEDSTTYFDVETAGVTEVPCLLLQDAGMEFHVSRQKIHEWYLRELSSKKKVVFEAKRFSRTRNGELSYDGIPCACQPDAEEPGLTEDMRNIVACAFPNPTPDLRIVYGNKWIHRKFNLLLQRRLSLFLIRTDYVPAFLADPFEVCVYLFLMDYCIIKEDCGKVKDKDLRKLLHIFRPSPMLQVKKLLS